MRPWQIVVLGVVAALVIAEAAIVVLHWPYARERVVEGLQRATGSDFRFSGFRPTYFPHPGCVFENATFVRSNVQLASVHALKVEGAWSDVLTFRHRMDRMRVEGLHVRIPREVPAAVNRDGKKRPETIIGELIADGAILEIAGEKKVLRFDFPHLAVRNVAKSQRIRFETTAHISEPPGTVTTSGDIGPWNTGDAGETQISGSFQLHDADLSHYEAILGALAGNGSFRGTLANIAVRGDTLVPNFQLRQSPNAVRLEAAYEATVNAITGDVTLTNVRAQFLRTRLHAHGGISKGTATVDFDTNDSRIQDLLRLFGSSEHPALNGPIAFRAHTVLPKGDEPFLHKLRLDGKFGIDNGQFTKSGTQEKVNELSARARGEGKQMDDGVRPESVVSDLSGRVALRQGVAHCSDLGFRVPGATARGAGTYSLLTKRIDLSGSLAMEADLPHTTSGIKSVLLKPFSWFFDKKKGGGSIVAVRMTGVYPNPRIQMSLLGKK